MRFSQKIFPAFLVLAACGLLVGGGLCRTAFGALGDAARPSLSQRGERGDSVRGDSFAPIARGDLKSFGKLNGLNKPNEAPPLNHGNAPAAAVPYKGEGEVVQRVPEPSISAILVIGSGILLCLNFLRRRQRRRI